MSRWIRGLRAPLLVLALSASSSQAQGRYRVLVGLAGQRAAVVEFRPCVPAEGSDCGARIDRMIDLAADSSVSAPSVLSTVTAGRQSVTIIDGTLVVVPLGNEGAKHERPLRRDTPLTAHALALSDDSQYVFVAFQSGAAAVPPEIRMIDLSTGTSIAHAVLPAQPGGVSMVP